MSMIQPIHSKCEPEYHRGHELTDVDRMYMEFLYKWLDRCVSAFLSSWIATNFVVSPGFGLSMCRFSREAAGFESSSLSKIRHVVRLIGKLKANLRSFFFLPHLSPEYVGPDPPRCTRSTSDKQKHTEFEISPPATTAAWLSHNLDSGVFSRSLDAIWTKSNQRQYSPHIQRSIKSWTNLHINYSEFVCPGQPETQ
jgi:hypothetical protein